MPRLIIGCGYTGERLAARWLKAQHTVVAAVSRPARADALNAAGIDAYAWNLDDPVAPPFTSDALSHVIYLAPPRYAGDDDPRLSAALNRLSAPPRKVIYISTTGVYGNRDGDMVNEDDPPNPESARAKRRLAAETSVRRWAEDHNTTWVVLRVPGIYGPGRLPLQTIMDRRPILERRAAGPGNRIHVDDLVTVIDAAAGQNIESQIINVGDGDHRSTAEFVYEVARQAGLAPPPEVDLDTLREQVSDMAWSFIRESRRIDVTRMHRVLAPALLYTDPAAGIAASLNG